MAQLEEINDCFDFCDKDKAGKLRKEDVGSALRSLGQVYTKADLDALLEGKDEEIDRASFLEMAKKYNPEQKQKDLREAFKVLDTSGSGSIDFQELERIVTSLGDAINKDEFQDILKKAGQPATTSETLAYLWFDKDLVEKVPVKAQQKPVQNQTKSKEDGDVGTGLQSQGTQMCNQQMCNQSLLRDLADHGRQAPESPASGPVNQKDFVQKVTTTESKAQQEAAAKKCTEEKAAAERKAVEEAAAKKAVEAQQKATEEEAAAKKCTEEKAAAERKTAEEAAAKKAAEAQRKATEEPVQNQTKSKDDGDVGAVLQSRGTQICNQSVFRDLAERGRKAPESYATSVQELVKYLKQETSSDEQVAWVLFNWICHHIRYDVNGLHGHSRRQSCEPADVLKSRVCVCAGYARLFEALASEAGLLVKYVSGHTRNLKRSVDYDPLQCRDPGHAWNAVKLGDEWILIDCTWAVLPCSNDAALFKGQTSSSANVRPHFFGVVPEQFIFSHFPKDSSWQLLQTPVSYADFINQPILCTNSFFGHGLAFPSAAPGSTKGLRVAKGSCTGSIELNAPENVEFLAKLKKPVGVELPNFKAEFSRLSATHVAIEFTLPSKKGFGGRPVPRLLEIYVRGGPSGTYNLACKFLVQHE